MIEPSLHQKVSVYLPKLFDTNPGVYFILTQMRSF